MPKRPKSGWAATAYAYANAKIEVARNTKSHHLDLSSRKSLAEIPPLNDLPNVRSLDLEGTNIVDISATANLPQLISLDLRSTPVTDISPVASLHNLRTLIIWDTEVQDISPIHALKNLQHLDAMGSKISSLQPAALLENLKIVDVTFTKVDDLSWLRNAKSLSVLRCTRTRVTSLEPLQNLIGIETLYAGALQVSDISALANLVNMKTLVLDNTQVRDISSLSRLTALSFIGLAGTPVSDIAPIAQLKELQSLDISRTAIVDLAPLAKLPKLRSLDVSGLKLESWDFLAELTSLALGAREYRNRGLTATGCKTGDNKFDEILSLANPDRTTRAVNYVRDKLGLPQLTQEQLGVSTTELLRNLQEDPLGARAVVARDAFELVSAAQEKFDDDLTVGEQAHQEVLRKAKILHDDYKGIGNQLGWKRLPETAALLLDELQRPFSDLAKRGMTLWSLSASLGSFLEQNREAKSNRASMVEPLEPNVERDLSDLVLTSASFVRMFETAKRLDAGLIDFSSPPETIEAAHELAVRAGNREVLRETDAQTIANALSATANGGQYTRRAHGFGVKTMINLVAAATAFIYGGGIKKAAEKYVEKSNLTDKATNFLLDSEAEVLTVYKDAAPDAREAIRELLLQSRTKDAPKLPLRSR